MSEFCSGCPVNDVPLRDEQVPEAKRRIEFEVDDHQKILNGTHNRFVDGVYFERRDLKLNGEQKKAVYACVAKRICSECVQS